MSWVLVKAIKHEAPDDWSPIIDIFREYGIENTLEEKTALTGCYADVDGVQERIDGLREALSPFEIDEIITEPLVEIDWENEWRKHFKPRRIGEHFVVKPTWEDFESLPGDHIIVLDPGQAFGTGDHPTTRMCLTFLEELVGPDHSVLDLGCGSGILSIGAKFIGAAKVLAIDIEPLAVEVARENFTLNGVEAEVAVGDVTELELESGWDIVVSNIISATLINLAPDAHYALKPGGKWIVSGIIDQNWADVQKAAKTCGFTLETFRQEDGWTAGVFSK
ncbi:MAG: 50S ribosomal protein L11 methyltransferase [Armatimonadetes bacterium]|nr:50S ribosomal protein L11 methyltransferase [Armatimonadota bacterium]